MTMLQLIIYMLFQEVCDSLIIETTIAMIIGKYFSL